jgi:hypothetical protein
MDNVLQALLSWQFIFFALAIAAMTFVLRKVVEFAIDSPHIPTGTMTKENRFWTELILPISPVLMGAAIGFFATMYPFPDGIASASARIAFGMVAGLLSGLLYRVIKGVLVSKLSNSGVNPPTPPSNDDPGVPERNIDHN